jgi:hypothetical protein
LELVKSCLVAWSYHCSSLKPFSPWTVASPRIRLSIPCCQFQSVEIKIKSWQDWVHDAETSLCTKINIFNKICGLLYKENKKAKEETCSEHIILEKMEKFASNMSSCRTYHGDQRWCPNPRRWLAGSSCGTTSTAVGDQRPWPPRRRRHRLIERTWRRWTWPHTWMGFALVRESSV